MAGSPDDVAGILQQAPDIEPALRADAARESASVRKSSAKAAHLKFRELRTASSAGTSRHARPRISFDCRHRGRAAANLFRAPRGSGFVHEARPSSPRSFGARTRASVRCAERPILSRLFPTVTSTCRFSRQPPRLSCDFHWRAIASSGGGF